MTIIVTNHLNGAIKPSDFIIDVTQQTFVAATKSIEATGEWSRTYSPIIVVMNRHVLSTPHWFWLHQQLLSLGAYYVDRLELGDTKVMQAAHRHAIGDVYIGQGFWSGRWSASNLFVGDVGTRWSGMTLPFHMPLRSGEMLANVVHSLGLVDDCTFVNVNEVMGLPLIRRWCAEHPLNGRVIVLGEEARKSALPTVSVLPNTTVYHPSFVWRFYRKQPRRIADWALKIRTATERVEVVT